MQYGFIDELRTDAQHSGDVAEVAIGSARFEVFELTNDHVFEWREPDAFAADCRRVPVTQGPCMERIVTREIDIRAE